jgi:hypothetical protein
MPIATPTPAVTKEGQPGPRTRGAAADGGRENIA